MAWTSTRPAGKAAAIAVVIAGTPGRAAGARTGRQRPRAGVHDQRHHHRARWPVAGRLHYGAP